MRTIATVASIALARSAGATIQCLSAPTHLVPPAPGSAILLLFTRPHFLGRPARHARTQVLTALLGPTRLFRKQDALAALIDARNKKSSRVGRIKKSSYANQKVVASSNFRLSWQLAATHDFSWRGRPA